MHVKSLIKPPGIPDWATRKRLVKPGFTIIEGRAWSGEGRKIIKVEVLLDGEWVVAKLENHNSNYKWIKWQCNWYAKPGHYVLSCRATDEKGCMQPESPKFNIGGFENNAIQKVEVFVHEVP